MIKNKKTIARYASNNVYPLSGLIVCGHCGSAYCGQSKKAKGKYYYYYRCSSNSNNGICKAKDIRKDLLEESVIKELEARLYSSKGIDETARFVYSYAISKNMHDNKIINTSKVELEKINLQISKLLDAIINGMFHESMKEKMSELESKKQCIEKEIRYYEENVDSYIPDIKTIKGMIACENIRLMDQNELKRCFQKYIKKITIQDGDKIQISLVVHTFGTP